MMYQRFDLVLSWSFQNMQMKWDLVAIVPTVYQQIDYCQPMGYSKYCISARFGGKQEFQKILCVLRQFATKNNIFELQLPTKYFSSTHDDNIEYSYSLQFLVVVKISHDLYSIIFPCISLFLPAKSLLTNEALVHFRGP